MLGEVLAALLFAAGYSLIIQAQPSLPSSFRATTIHSPEEVTEEGSLAKGDRMEVLAEPSVEHGQLFLCGAWNGSGRLHHRPRHSGGRASPSIAFGFRFGHESLLEEGRLSLAAEPVVSGQRLNRCNKIIGRHAASVDECDRMTELEEPLPDEELGARDGDLEVVDRLTRAADELFRVYTWPSQEHGESV